MSELGNKKIMGQNIQRYMKQIGIDRKELCQRLGFKYSTVTDWINGEKYPRIDKIEIMANFFGISKADLVEPQIVKESKIPILGSVAAGTPIDAYEDLMGYVEDKDYHSDGHNYFALRIKGHSMEPTIKDGDIVIVRQQPTVDSGDIAIVLVDGESATAKEVHIRKDGITLVGHNPSVYTPHFYSNEDVATLPVNILGRVMEVRRYL